MPRATVTITFWARDDEDMGDAITKAAEAVEVSTEASRYDAQRDGVPCGPVAVSGAGWRDEDSRQPTQRR